MNSFIGWRVGARWMWSQATSNCAVSFILPFWAVSALLLYQASITGFTWHIWAQHASPYLLPKYLITSKLHTNQLPGTMWGKGNVTWGRTEQKTTHFSKESWLRWGALSNISVCTKASKWESWQFSSWRAGMDLMKSVSRLLNRDIFVRWSDLSLGKSLVHSGWTEAEKRFIPVA